jgi:hydrogenase expression/formation protein HypD
MNTAAAPRASLEQLAVECAELAAHAADRIGGTVQLMEVCGTHTHAIARAGIRERLGSSVRLVSGPGCPVCVTTAGQIDLCLQLAERDDVAIATFGDMIRVPGTHSSLAEARARGAHVKVVYSPMECLDLARGNRRAQVVMAAVGFETTAPTIACMVREAASAGLDNLMVLCAHKLVPPAMRALLSAPDVRLHGFICPGHVSVVIGSDAYRGIVEEYGVPCVVAGFEPPDILLAVRALLRQVAEGAARVENEYGRAVRPGGNPHALEAIASVFDVCDASWRGIGTIPQSGLCLRDELARFDVMGRLGLTEPEAKEHPACHCGEVLQGKLLPAECPAFAKACNPTRPLGPCMVSSEGACAAQYRYRTAP